MIYEYTVIVSGKEEKEYARNQKELRRKINAFYKEVKSVMIKKKERLIIKE